jgi:hypothetical protein
MNKLDIENWNKHRDATLVWALTKHVLDHAVIGVHLDHAPRQTGATTWIIHQLAKYHDSVVLSPTAVQARMLVKLSKELLLPLQAGRSLCVRSHPSSLRGMTPSVIFVDDTENITASERYSIMDYAAVCRTQVVCFL